MSGPEAPTGGGEAPAGGPEAPTGGGVVPGAPSQPAPDTRRDMVAAARALAAGVVPQGTSMTSDLSIDEELALHAVGWEPLELVCGASLHSVPVGIWTWGQGEISSASQAYAASFAAASDRIHRECAKAGGHGVVGVRVELEVHRHHVDLVLVGTAVRPVRAGSLGDQPVFVSDLSGRDFAVLSVAGWQPLGLAAGASFVYAPRRSVGQVMRQTSQNVELTNYTEAMYAARESAMERMQESAIRLGGTGVVEVKVAEGPMAFARHAISFTAYGTVVRLSGHGHQRLGPVPVVPLDEDVRAFDAASLRGR